MSYCIWSPILCEQGQLNFESGRYELFGGCREEDTINTIYDTGLKDSVFSVQGLRKSGR